jgi:putative ubiquitin-RnfH superfamily antitoxin RatB of RatAB toxin-antitoxin module
LKRIRVEVVYALPQAQHVAALGLEEGAAVRSAVDASGLLEGVTAGERALLRFAIYGKLVGLERRLADGERVEILRPLAADPKEARRSRARRGPRGRRKP